MIQGDFNNIEWGSVPILDSPNLYLCAPQGDFEMVSPLGLIFGYTHRGAWPFEARLELGEYYENHICRFLAISGLSTCRFDKYTDGVGGPTIIVEGRRVAAPDRVVISNRGEPSFLEIKSTRFFKTINGDFCVGMSKKYYEQYFWTAEKWPHMPYSIFFVVTDDQIEENNGLYHIGRSLTNNIGYWVANDQYEGGFVYWKKESLTKVPGYIPIPVNARAN